MPRSSRRRVASLVVAGVAAIAAPGFAAEQAAGQQGELKIRVTGLPAGEKPVAVVRGNGVRRVVRRARTALRVPAGAYSVRLKRAKLKRAHKGIRKGSLAIPARGSVRARVAGGDESVLTAGYGAIVSAGASTVPARGVRVTSGEPGDPRELVLPRGRRRYKVGGFLTSGPTAKLPGGLIARITSVRRSRRGVRVGLQTVPVATVVPVHSGGLRASSAGSMRIVKPASGDATRRIQGPDLGAGGNLFAAALGEAIGTIPCTQAGGAPGGTYARPKGEGPTFAAFEWSVMDPHVRVAGSYSPSIEWSLAKGATLECAAATDFGRVFPAPVGPLVLPVYIGAHLELGGAIARTDAASSGEMGAKLTFEADTRRGDTEWLRWQVAPIVAASAELRLATAARLELGIGAPHVTNMRFSAGPEAAATFSTANWSAVRCELAANLRSRLRAELPVKTFALDLAERSILGPLAQPFCSATEPIVGDWRYADRSGSIRIAQTGPGTFAATALTDITLDGDATCRLLGAGGLHKTFAGGLGAYRTQYSFYDRVGGVCRLAETDGNAVVTIDWWSADNMRICGTTPTRTSCDTLGRIASP
jgi:hypothetical protein